MTPSAEAEPERGTCPICLDFLDTGSRVVSLAPCGHLIHRACYDRCAAAAAGGLGGPPGPPRCPMCRGSVAEDRVRSASAVPGARLTGGGGYAQYAARSAAPPPPPRDLRPATWASMAPVPGPAAGGLREATGAPAATNIPTGARNQLLAGIMAQLGAADAPVSAPPQPPTTAAEQDAQHAGLRLLRQLHEQHAAIVARRSATAAAAAQAAPAVVSAVPAAPAAPRAAAPAPVTASNELPSTWCFSIDVSSSMGSSQDWQPGAVSRLCFALASLACVVEAKVAPGDWVTVQAFDADQATLMRWFRRPAAFDKAAFLAELTGAVRACGLNRFGTCTCAAAKLAVETLATKANSLAAPAGEMLPAVSGSTTQQGITAGVGAALADVGAAPADVGAAHSLVLLTDGWADDQYSGFDAAAALLRDPPFVAGGFKALLTHIASEGESASCLARLAADAAGTPLDYVQVLRLQIGASLDLSAAAHAAAALPLPAAPGHPTRQPMAAAAVTTAAAAAQFAAAAAAPSPFAPPSFPMPAPHHAPYGAPSAAAGVRWMEPAEQRERRWGAARGWGAIGEGDDEDRSGRGDWRSVRQLSSGISSFATSRATSRPSASASALRSRGGWN